LSFSDYRTALVTGASAGMGAAIVERFCNEGLTVHAVARRPDRLEELARRTGCIPHAMDMTDIDALTALLTGLEVDVLVNNAGVGGQHLQCERRRHKRTRRPELAQRAA
jgi:NADP-dependent 3-hydroxy acid dehydrogenase YdfG